MPEPFRVPPRHARPPFISTSLEGLERVIPPEAHLIGALSARHKFDKPLPDIPSGISSGDGPESGTSEIIESYMCSGLAKVSLTSPSSVVVRGNRNPVSADRSTVKFPASRFRTNTRQLPLPGAPGANLQVQAASYSRYEPIPARRNLPYCQDQHCSSCPELRTCRDNQPTHYGFSRMEFDSPFSHEAIGTVDPSLIPPPLDLDGSQRWRHDSSGGVLDREGSAIPGFGSHESARSLFRSWISEDTLSTESAEEQPASLLSASADFPLRRTLGYVANGEGPGPEECTANAHQEMKAEWDNRTQLYYCSSPSLRFGGGGQGNYSRPQRRKQLAIPLSDYQKYGPAAWKNPKLKPKRNTISRCTGKLRENITQQAPAPKRPPRPQIPPPPLWDEGAGQSHRNGSRHWWSSTLKVARVKLRMLTRTEQKKERLKNQIVVVRPADQFADGRVNHWV